jgi:nicotinate-nucleotide pyrophosphorylase
VQNDSLVFLARLSGIATQTNAYIEAIKPPVSITEIRENHTYLEISGKESDLCRWRGESSSRPF